MLDPKIERFQRDILCDILFKCMQLVIFSIVIIVDRANVGFIGSELDFWINCNLGVLALEICFRWVMSKCVRNHNFDSIQKMDWCLQLWVHGFTIWGL